MPAPSGVNAAFPILVFMPAAFPGAAFTVIFSLNNIYLFVDPDAASLILGDDPGLAEVDPDAASLIIV
jgi:hypothetical protein